MTGDFRHGGALDVMRVNFPEAPTHWMDLSTGLNPWSYPVEDLLPSAVQHLPTQTAYQNCQAAMASAIEAPAGSLLLAAGSEVLIRLLPTILSPKRVAILSPTYGDHAHVWRSAGCEIIETPEPIIYAGEADIVVVCNPNNPDGRLFSLEDLEAARVVLARRGGWLIVDEAYADLNPSRSLAQQGGAPGLIILRSLGKFYGLAGLRLGAMIAPGEIRAQMAERLGVWNVSGPALQLGAQAYQDIAWQEATRARLAEARERLADILGLVRPKTITGTDLYRYIEHEQAPRLWQHLANNGIYVRRFADRIGHLRFGLPPDDEAEARLKKTLGQFSL